MSVWFTRHWYNLDKDVWFKNMNTLQFSKLRQMLFLCWDFTDLFSFPYTDVGMSIGLGGQSATCVTPQSMPSLKREQVIQQIYCFLVFGAPFERWWLSGIFISPSPFRLWWRFQWKGECGIHWTGGIRWWIWWSEFYRTITVLIDLCWSFSTTSLEL